MDRFYETQVDMLALEPYAVKQEGFESSISSDKRSRERTLLITLRREYFHLLDSIKRLVYRIVK